MNQRADPIRDAGIVIRSTIQRPPQRDRILAMLREAGAEGVCSWAFYRAYMPHVSSRIPELHEQGYDIDSETRNWGDEHGVHSHYYLLSEPAPEQMLTGVV